jgi:hypothetical protein
MQYRRCVPLNVAVLAVSALSMAVDALGQAPAAPAETAAPTWAVWTPKELRLVYMGFTSHYSCDGLRDKMRAILLQLGARPDLTVREVPCSGLAGRPTEFPGVTVTMNVLKPWDAETADAAATPVPAHWKWVEISTDRDPLREAGDCELIEQVKPRVLPLFNARNVDYHSTCIPHQLQIGGTQLKAELLIADDQGAQPSGAPPTGSPPPPAPTPPPAPPQAR